MRKEEKGKREKNFAQESLGIIPILFSFLKSDLNFSTLTLPLDSSHFLPVGSQKKDIFAVQ